MDNKIQRQLIEESMKSRITFEDGKYRYFDKNGIELKEDDVVEFEDGRREKLYLTVQGMLGTDATNPKWIESGRAAPGEFGIYPLSRRDLLEIHKVNLQETEGSVMKIM